MANAKQVLDVQVSKGITAAQGNEHLRNRSKEAEKYAMSKGNYDPTRKHLNFEIASGGKIRPIDTSRNIPERMADILGRRGIKDPNEGLIEPKYRTVVNIIFGGSRERMHELAFGTQKVDFEKGADNTSIKRKSDIERWAKDVYSFVCGRYGEQNVAAFIVHLDELNPHVHCTLLPIKDGKFAYKEIFAGKDKFEYSARMKQLHTDFFAEVNTKWGMARGRSVAETGARHRTTEEYRRMLSEECTTIEENIDRHQKVLSDLHSDIRLAERRVKGLTSMVENLRREKSEKEAQLAALENDMNSRKDDALAISAEKEKLEKELVAIQGKLADKQEKLQTADTIPLCAGQDTLCMQYLARMQNGKECIGSPVYFFFQLNTARLTDTSQTLNLDELARVAKKYGLSVSVIGAADSMTGTASVNNVLSASRADYIAEELIKRGVSGDKITKTHQGGISDYAPNEANRHTKVMLHLK